MIYFTFCGNGAHCLLSQSQCLLVSHSPIAISMMLPPIIQWAAVRTYLRLIKLAPQLYIKRPLLNRFPKSAAKG